MNGTLVKNQLIFEYASGMLGPSKSIFASTYLYLNSKASNINRTFENMLGDNLIENSDTPLVKIKYSDCMTGAKSNNYNNVSKDNSPITKVGRETPSSDIANIISLKNPLRFIPV